MRIPIELVYREWLHHGLQLANDFLFAPCGVKLTRASRPTRSYTEFFRQLRKAGFHPQTVIDVGVAYGTPDLYRAFPSAQYFLVEPLAFFEPYLQQVQRKINATYFLCGAGDSERTVSLNVLDDPRESSTLSRPHARVESVSIKPLDVLIPSIKKPALLKIDAEGAELDALKGARQLLPQLEVVIVESRLVRYRPEMPTTFEIMAYMADRGFRLYDLLDGGYQRQSGVCELIDLAFVSGNSALLQDGSSRW